MWLLCDHGREDSGELRNVRSNNNDNNDNNNPPIQVEKNFEAAGLESAAFFRPCTLVGNTNSPRIGVWMTKMVSWALPLKYKEIHIEDVGAAMVKVAVKSLDDAGPKVAHYEGASLFGLLEEKKT